MALVIDCSIAMAWLLPDEDSNKATKALAQVARDGAIAPPLWVYETQNALLVARRRKRIDAEFVRSALRSLRKLPIAFPEIHGIGRELSLAEPLGLTAYDAAYLAMAIEHHATLATADRELAAAARKRGIALL